MSGGWRGGNRAKDVFWEGGALACEARGDMRRRKYLCLWTQEPRRSFLVAELRICLHGREEGEKNAHDGKGSKAETWEDTPAGLCVDTCVWCLRPMIGG